jgi:glutamyl-tRNA reductase
MRLVATGLSHRSAPVAIRERLALEAEALREILGEARHGGVVREAVVLSTCNRVELYAVAEAPAEARDLVFALMAGRRGLEPGAMEPWLYTHLDGEAVHHAFRVAASLDSLIVGEPQILGQVKEAFALAAACEAVGPTLHALFSRAFAVAKRVRTETEIGRHAVSVSFAAVELARKMFDSLGGRAVLLVGAGKMGELAARHLLEQGACPLRVTNRTWARAQDFARRLGAEAVPFDALPAAVAAADIVITSTGAPRPLIDRAMVARAREGRRGRPLFLIDIAVPRDVAEDVQTLDDVYCYDIDDLRQVVDANLRERMREAQQAEALVEREAATFVARLAEVEVVPTIVSLRERLEAIRLGELRKALARVPDAPPETRDAMEALSQAIVNKILHAPITKLRESSRAGAGRGWTELVTELFGLGRRA